MSVHLHISKTSFVDVVMFSHNGPDNKQHYVSLGAIPKTCPVGILIFVPFFVSRDFEVGSK